MGSLRRLREHSTGVMTRDDECWPRPSRREAPLCPPPSRRTWKLLLPTSTLMSAERRARSMSSIWQTGRLEDIWTQGRLCDERTFVPDVSPIVIRICDIDEAVDVVQVLHSGGPAGLRVILKLVLEEGDRFGRRLSRPGVRTWCGGSRRSTAKRR